MRTRGKLHLIVMTRLPQAGRTKTRLIPALGADGAARLHDRLARHAIGRASAFCLEKDHHLSVLIAGGTPIQGRAWLGDTALDCTEQSGGDLGQRLTQASQAAFDHGASRVIIIGTDCPSLDTTTYLRATELLETRDIVLGPAEDGGYYLIGMNQHSPELFENISWGTETVMRETQRAAQAIPRSVGLCDPLPDVDLPEDLENAETELRRGNTVSIIIPTLNEARNIGGLLKKLASSSPHEIIVCDAGSDDETVSIARENAANVISCKPNRSFQMNRGATIASGEFLLFLHADTEVPQDFPEIIPTQLNRPNTSAGAFTFRLDDELGAAALIETLVAWRCRLCQSPYGDQGLFLRKSTFHLIGGFPESPVAEDLLLVRKLRRLGKIRIASQPAVTSSRRWRKQGLIRTFLSHQTIVLLSLFRSCKPFPSRFQR